MNISIPPAVADALRLTRQGRLGEATASIQAALTGGSTTMAARSDPAEPIDLTAHKPDLPRLPGQSAPSQPSLATGSFLARSHAGVAGGLSYRLYLPRNLRDGMPLVVMLHGCTQTAEDFARGTGMNRLADELGFLVAYPAQSKSANPQGCWNWFKPGDQQRDRGEPAMIAAITREVIAEHRVDRARVYVAGLSAGGAQAAIMGAAYPDLYAAVGIHSGLASGAARDLPSALMAMRSGGGRASPAQADARFVPVITFHGDRDATVHESNSGDIIAVATASSRVSLRTRVETGGRVPGRRYTRTISFTQEDRALIEQWTIHGGGHAWSGGDAAGSYTDPSGPDASREMLRFFLSHNLDEDLGLGGGQPGNADAR